MLIHEANGPLDTLAIFATLTGAWAVDIIRAGVITSTTSTREPRQSRSAWRLQARYRYRKQGHRPAHPTWPVGTLGHIHRQHRLRRRHN